MDWILASIGVILWYVFVGFAIWYTEKDKKK